MKPDEIVKELSKMAIEYASIDVCNAKRIKALSSAADLIEGLIPRPIEEVPEGVPFFSIDDFGNPLLTNVTPKPRTFVTVSAIQKLMESGE